MARDSLTYRPELDGVRGLGMVLIMCYHLEQVDLGHQLGSPAGGWIGLDLFFALSGLLITGLLLKEWERRAQVNLRRFYARRLARLAPALIVLLGVQAVATSLDGTAATRKQLPGSLAWVLSELGNVGVLTGGVLGKLDHTWSLAVEEQFYFVWPVLLVLALKAGWTRQRLRRWLGAAIATLAAAGLIASLSGVSVNDTYYATPFRMNEILVGCWAALATKPFTRRLVREAAVALLILVAAVLPQNSRLPAGGAYTLIAICAATVMMDAGRPWWGHTVLSWAPFVAIGRVSYSLYLWHWPTYYAVRFTLGAGRPITVIAAPCAAVFLALLSSRFVEMPFRQAAAARHAGIPAGVAWIAVVEVVVVGTAASAAGLQVLPTVVVCAAGVVVLTGVMLGRRHQRLHPSEHRSAKPDPWVCQPPVSSSVRPRGRPPGVARPRAVAPEAQRQ